MEILKFDKKPNEKQLNKRFPKAQFNSILGLSSNWAYFCLAFEKSQ